MKGESRDNAACEGFFGRMNTEMCHGIRWERAADPEVTIDEYIVFYNNQRIKMSLGNLTIKEHRDRLMRVSKIVRSHESKSGYFLFSFVFLLFLAFFFSDFIASLVSLSSGK